MGGERAQIDTHNISGTKRCKRNWAYAKTKFENHINCTGKCMWYEWNKIVLTLLLFNERKNECSGNIFFDCRSLIKNKNSSFQVCK